MSPQTAWVYTWGSRGGGGGGAAGAWGPDVHVSNGNTLAWHRPSATREICFQGHLADVGTQGHLCQQHAVCILPTLRKPEIPLLELHLCGLWLWFLFHANCLSQGRTSLAAEGHFVCMNIHSVLWGQSTSQDQEIDLRCPFIQQVAKPWPRESKISLVSVRGGTRAQVSWFSSHQAPFAGVRSTWTDSGCPWLLHPGVNPHDFSSLPHNWEFKQHVWMCLKLSVGV